MGSQRLRHNLATPHTCTHVYTHTLEYYSAIKRNEIIPCVATWTELSEVSQKEKDKYLISLLYGI